MTAGVTNLIWHGSETMEAAAAALGRGADIELQFPANFHHAVVAHFRSAQVAPAAEAIDVTGGAELLAHFRSLRGLERVAALAEPARRVHAEVRVASPAPIVAIRCQGAAEARVK